MSDFYNEFTNTSQEEWLKKVSQDLKGKKFGLTVIKNIKTKSMNKSALHLLMTGATGLRMDLSDFNRSELNILFNDIGFEHIVTTFIYHNKIQFDALNDLGKQFNKIIGTAINSSDESFGLVSNMRNRLIDGTKVQSTGGNVTQEIAYCLSEGHRVLHDLMENEGLSIDKAASQIKFKVGIGGNYFFEIAKLKTLRSLWYNIVNAYSPEHSCSTIAYIEAETGFVNKSLKDPNTNLLRQTTEALSAVIGGVDELTVLPYNWKAKNPDLQKTQRLATNIALLLKEESYLDKVVDPSGGAYSQEKMISALQKNTWELFLKLEKEGNDSLVTEIQNTASKRIELIKNKENTLIGINKYFNSESKQETWKETQENEFGMELILELECNITVA